MTAKAAAPRRKSPTQHDWVALKAAYVQGVEVEGKREANPTLDELSARFGTPVSTLRKRSMNEKWVEERNLFQARLAEKQQAKTTELLASTAAEFDALSLRASQKKMLLIERKIDKAASSSDGLSPAEVRALAGAMKDVQYVGRLALGDSTENTRINDQRDDDDTRAEALASRLAAKLAAGTP